MGNKTNRKRRSCRSTCLPSWWVFAIVILFVVVSVSSDKHITRGRRQITTKNPEDVKQDLSTVVSTLPNIPEVSDNGSSEGSAEFTLITPFGGGNGKHRKVVRRRRKKVSTSTLMPSVITSVTVSGEQQPEPVTSLPIFEAPPRRKPSRKRGHNNKVPEVWKVQTFNLDQVVPAGDIKQSILDKRESSEKTLQNRQNETETDNINKDLTSEESNNPFVNSSTPISNELQNSLQFTLQFLHPLLNSDTVLSENSPKLPENKTVALSHSLSDSFAQTPVAADIGFHPTHLRKKHPLLTQDSIFAGGHQSGASKTGVRINDDNKPVRNATTEIPKSSTISTEPPATLKTPSTSVKVRTSTSTITQAPKTTTTKSTSTSTRHVTKRPVVTTTTRRTTPLITRNRPTTTSTTTVGTTTHPTTSLPSSSSTSSTSTTSKATKVSYTPNIPLTTPIIPFDIDHILGILNITEITNGSLEDPTIYPTLAEAAGVKPEVIIQKTTPSQNKATTPATSLLDNGSAEVSSDEQALLEQLLGLANGGKSQELSPTASNSQSDSGEQLLQLLTTLVQNQNQGQTQGNPPSKQNIFTSQTTTTSTTKKPNNAVADDAQVNAFLQNLILSSLAKPQNQQQNLNDFANNLLKLESIFAASSTTSKPPITTPRPPATTISTLNQSGLSDADLKSIFELLDSQSPKTSTTTRATTITTTTPTPRPTTPRTDPPVATSTTLHPALQSMLDLFTNQLKPFQNIPSTATTFLQSQVTPASTKPPTTTTLKPATTLATSTINSIDLLTQLLSLGGAAGGLTNKVNPVRSTPPPATAPAFNFASIFGGMTPKPQQTDFSLASIFGKNNNLFPPPAPVHKSPSLQPELAASSSSESNQLLNFFGTPTTAPPNPNGLYYWLDMNAFLGGDTSKTDGSSGIRPKIGSKWPFLKVNM